MKYVNILALLILLGCGPVYERGNGNLSTTEKVVRDFSEIRIDGQFEVFLEEGDENVRILTDENLHKYIDIYVDGDVLYIEAIERIASDDGIKVYIDYEHLESLELRGAPVVSNERTLNSKRFYVEVNGAAIVKLDLDVRDLEVQISGAGLVELSGEARDMEIDMSGTGNLSAYDLKCDNADIELSGVGAAQVNVSKRLTGKVSGVGSINYKGDPKNVDTHVSGIGQVKPASRDDKSDVDIDI